MNEYFESNEDALQSLNQYRQRVTSVGINDNFLRPGAFYSFFYNFLPDNRDVDFEVTRWYDFFPLLFVTDRWESKDGNLIITGINFHHVPRLMRMEWFENMKTSYGDIFQSESKYILLQPLQILMRQRKLYYAIRNYTENRIIKPMRIPNSKVQEIANLNSKTHYGVSPIGISNRMRSKPIPTNIINIRKKK